MSESEKVNRRGFLKYAATTVGGLIVGGVIGHLLAPRAPAEISTVMVTEVKTTTKTVTQTVSPTPTAPPAAIRILGTEGPVPPAVEKNINKFGEVANADVTYESFPWTGFHEKGTMSLTLPGKGMYDAVVINCDWCFPAWHEYLEPLDEYVKRDNFDTSDFLPNAIKHFCMWPKGMKVKPTGLEEGELLGLPHLSDAMFFVIRKDLLEKAGCRLPTMDDPYTLEEFKEVCKKLSNPPEIYGLGFYHQEEGGMPDTWTALYFAIGGEKARWFNEDLTAAINNEYAKQAAEFLKDFYDEGITPLYQIEQAWGWLEENFKAGKLAAIHSWGLGALSLKDPSYNPLWDKTELVLPPVGPTGTPLTYYAGWSWGIPKNAPNKELAWEFLKWITAPEQQEAHAIQCPPTRISVLNKLGKEREYYNWLRWVAERARVLPAIPQLLEVNRIVFTQLTRYWRGEIDVDTAFETAEDEINSLMRRLGYIS